MDRRWHIMILHLCNRSRLKECRVLFCASDFGLCGLTCCIEPPKWWVKHHGFPHEFPWITSELLVNFDVDGKIYCLMLNQLSIHSLVILFLQYVIRHIPHYFQTWDDDPTCSNRLKARNSFFQFNLTIYTCSVFWWGYPLKFAARMLFPATWNPWCCVML